jgi:hypothetical protein
MIRRKGMKRTPKRLAALTLVCLAVLASSADEMTFIFRRIYQQAETLRQKEAATLAILSREDPGNAAVLEYILEDLLKTGPEVAKGSPDRQIWNNLVRRTVGALGTLRYVEAAPFAWDAYAQADDPLTRAEALMALGNMRALEYTERIALVLRNLNFEPVQDREAGEKTAFGAILALEKLRDPAGFAPVFFASEGWYTRRVRDQALRSLPLLAEDPTDPVRQLILEESLDRKLKAFDLHAASKAPDERKIEIARLALQRGIEIKARDRAEGTRLRDLRVRGMRSLVALKAGGGASTVWLQEAFKLGETDERLLALQALGTDASDPSARVLADILLELDAQQRAGIADEVRNRVAAAAIQYAGTTRNRLVRPALTAISLNDKWSNSLIRAAQDALKELP